MIRDPEVISIEGWLSRQPGRLAIDLQNYCLNYLQVSKHGDGFFPIFLGRFSVQIMRTVKLRFGRLDPNFVAENPINHQCSLWLINLWNMANLGWWFIKWFTHQKWWFSSSQVAQVIAKTCSFPKFKRSRYASGGLGARHCRDWSQRDGGRDRVAWPRGFIRGWLSSGTLW